jgi:hypothetical protein
MEPDHLEPGEAAGGDGGDGHARARAGAGDRINLPATPRG